VVLGFTTASAACAVASEFWWLILARIVQGLFGGFLIPLAFSAAFLMFSDGADRMRATMIAGVLAMLAPTLGPTVGGFITELYSWHWLFLINLPPGLIVAAVAARSVRVDQPEQQRGAGIDLATGPLLAMFLASMQVVLSEAPRRGWDSSAMLARSALCLVAP
jgi:DHA2 family multidrug resistance protein